MIVRRRLPASSAPAIALVALLVITALGAWLRLYDLQRVGLGNLFYASTIRSMGQSWYHFLYAAYDPAAVLTVDKPPLALWLQVASTKLLGYNGVALVLPSALAGTLAVPLTFLAGWRSHGVLAGLAAALLLALLPESVATARDSTMDALMMSLLAGSGLLLVAAVDGNRPRLLLAWGVLMGLVFNVKFLEGFLVAPAATLYVAVRWRDEWRRRLPVLCAALTLFGGIALSWVSLLELTPPQSRPLVMNDVSNSAYGLVLRYNGLERLVSGEVAVFAAVPDASPAVNTQLSQAARRFGVGDSGPGRLLKGDNGPLLGTPVLLALLGTAVAFWRRRDWLAGPGLFWAAWALIGIGTLTVANRAPAHYVEAFAPALAVMGAVGLVEAWRATEGWRAVSLPVTALVTCGFSYMAVSGYPPLAAGVRLVALLGAGAALVALGAALARLSPPLTALLRGIALLAIPATMLPVSFWIAQDAPRGGVITTPNPVSYAGAAAAPPSRTVPAEAALRRMEVVGPQPRYALAIDGINSAGEAIAHTGALVLPLWNEYQRRPVLGSQALERLLRSGEVPYVLFDLARADRPLQADLFEVLGRHCALANAAVLSRTWRLARCG